MKLTKSKLKQIIKEEVQKVFHEQKDVELDPGAALKSGVDEGRDLRAIADYVKKIFAARRLQWTAGQGHGLDAYDLEDLSPEERREKEDYLLARGPRRRAAIQTPEEGKTERQIIAKAQNFLRTVGRARAAEYIHLLRMRSLYLNNKPEYLNAPHKYIPGYFESNEHHALKHMGYSDQEPRVCKSQTGRRRNVFTNVKGGCDIRVIFGGE